MNDEKPQTDETPTGAASALSAGLGAWMPIATAPKDGSDILAYNPATRKHVVVFWKRDAWIFPELVFSSSITHWMPLPDAPNVEFSGDAPPFGAASAGTQGYASGGDENV